MNHEPGNWSLSWTVQQTIIFSLTLLVLVIMMSSVLIIHCNAGHICIHHNAEAMNLQFYTSYLGGILNDVFINPFSSDAVSPTLHYVLNHMKKRNSLTVAPMNSEYSQVNQFSSWVVHSLGIFR